MARYGSINVGSGAAPSRRRGTIFKSATPFYAVESFVRRLREPGRARGMHSPGRLAQARAAFRNKPTGLTLGRWLTLEPDLLLEPCECVDPLDAELFVQLGQHREALLVATTTDERRAAREWLKAALFGGYRIAPRRIDRDLIFDTFWGRESAAWANLLRQRPGLLHAAAVPRDCESLRCARQRYIWTFIALHIRRMLTPPKAGLRRESRAALREAFLEMPNGWVLGTLEPEDLHAVYKACLDWVVHLDIPPDEHHADAGYDGIGSSDALPQTDLDYARSRLPDYLWRDVCSESSKEGALRLAAHLLGCSVEKVRRGMRVGQRTDPENDGSSLTAADYATEFSASASGHRTRQADEPTWANLEQRFRSIREPFMRADYVQTGSGDVSARVAGWSSAGTKAEFEDAARDAAALLAVSPSDSNSNATFNPDGEDSVSRWLVAVAEAVGDFAWAGMASRDEDGAAVAFVGSLDRVVEASSRFCAQRVCP